jgi:hypothetical protein
MIIENIRLELQNHVDKENVIKIWYIKEFLQTIVLKQIYELPMSKNLIFYGWTALRFIFGLNRLSEDLDFIWKWFVEFEELWQSLQTFFWKERLSVIYKIQKFRVTLNFKNFLDNFGINYWNSRDLYIKIEISDHIDFCKEFGTKLYPIFKFNQSLVLKSFDKSTLFSSKLNAVLHRNRKKQIWESLVSVKWRDIYDLFWYLSNGFTPNIHCIIWISDLQDLKIKLIAIIENINFKDVCLDIENFVEDRSLLEFMKDNGKVYLLEKVKEM